MNKLPKISIALALAIILSGCNKPEPDKISGEFFRFTVDVIYKGQPLRIKYPVACKFNISRNIDGDRSVDGASLAPSVFGRETPDGGALVIKTPNFCDYSKAIDENKVPSSYNPLIVHYQDAKSPTFGLGYYGAEAFDSPISVMKYTGSKTERISGEEFVDWRQKNPHANWVTYERMNAHQNIFEDRPWEPGTKHLATVCRGAFFYTPPVEFQQRLTQAWIDTGRPTYWADNKIASEIQRLEPEDKYTPVERRKPTSLFSGHPMQMYGYAGDRVREKAFPSDTDFDLNRTDQKARPTAQFITNSKNVYMQRDKVRFALRRSNIQFREELAGFLYCNSHDGNHIKHEDLERSFRGYPGLYLLNNKELVGDERSVPHYNHLLPSIKVMYEDKYVIQNIEKTYYSMGDKL